MNNFINKDILEYSEKYSQQEPEILQELNRETHLKILNPRMLSGFFQGRLLSIISKLIKPKKVLEIGTYTGYSAICIAEGMNKNGIIHTIDKNEELNTIQKKYFKKSGLENNIIQYNGCALDIIPKIKEKFDLIFIDADKENYINYFNLVIDKLNNNGVILADNVLWSGKVINSEDHDLTTNVLREFNKSVNNDNRVETILLPIRDGISIIRKI
ncbi:O-methyltransferase [Flavobacteriaceae bacterium]|jgi:caffeoyl-CoA O-methyltransferase|nr:O-methyltransferase [Flavobacteriaceae bacterium]